MKEFELKKPDDNYLDATVNVYEELGAGEFFGQAAQLRVWQGEPSSLFVDLGIGIGDGPGQTCGGCGGGPGAIARRGDRRAEGSETMSIPRNIEELFSSFNHTDDTQLDSFRRGYEVGWNAARNLIVQKLSEADAHRSARMVSVRKVKP